jgi:hypothetical protein
MKCLFRRGEGAFVFHGDPKIHRKWFGCEGLDLANDFAGRLRLEAMSAKRSKPPKVRNGRRKPLRRQAAERALNDRHRGILRLALGSDLPASVLPFILRNVTLAGIDSVNAPQRIRVEAWSRLALDLDLKKLAQATQVVGLAEVPDVARSLLEGEIRGRVVVDVNL